MRKSQLRAYQRASYHKGIVLLLEAHEILGNVRVAGWTQHVLLNDVFLRIEQAVETLAEVAPNELAPVTRQRVARGWDR